MAECQWLADQRCGDWHAELFGGFGDSFDGFGPWVDREAELCPVNGEEQLCSEIDGCLGGLFGHHVDIAPGVVVLAAFQDRQVKGGEFICDGFEVRFVSGVAAEKERKNVVEFEHIGDPQRFSADEAAAGEMAGRGCRQLDAGQRVCAFPPIEFGDLRSFDAAGLGERADAEWKAGGFYPGA